MKSLAEILGAMGLSKPQELRPWHIVKRVAPGQVKHYGEIFPYVEDNSFTKGNVPDIYKATFTRSYVDHF